MSLLIVVSGILSFTDRVVFKEEVVFRNDIFVCVRFLWFWLISQYSFPLTTVIFPSGPTCFVKVGFHVYLAPSPCTSHTPPLACTHFFPPCCQGGWSSCFPPTIQGISQRVSMYFSLQIRDRCIGGQKGPEGARGARGGQRGAYR